MPEGVNQSKTSFGVRNVSKMQKVETGCSYKEITQSCTLSTVGQVLQLYLLCPCQPVLHRDFFDNKAQLGFMPLVPHSAGVNTACHVNTLEGRAKKKKNRAE